MKLLHSPPFKSFEYVGENPSTFEVEWQHVPDWIQFPKCTRALENLSTGPELEAQVCSPTQPDFFWQYFMGQG